MSRDSETKPAGLDGLRGCEPGFIGDQVEGAEPVVFSPSAPVGQGCHVLLDIASGSPLVFVAARWSSHASSYAVLLSSTGALA
jgi:hypothetical protein